MRVQRARSFSGCWYVYFVAQNGDTFGLESFVFERDAQQYEARARHALAADAELTEQNKQLHEACAAYIKEVFDLKDQIAAERHKRHIENARPACWEHAAELTELKQENAGLRKQLNEAKEKYADLRVEIKNLL